MFFQISPLIIIEWNTERNLVLRNLKTCKEFVCRSGKDNLIKILSYFVNNGKASVDEIGKQYLVDIDYLITIGVLVNADEFIKLKKEVASWDKFLWRDAMLYHYGSNKPQYIEPYEGNWDSSRMKMHEQYLARDPLPEIYKSVRVKNHISVKGEILPLSDIDFFQLLSSRRTVRNFLPKPIDLDVLYSVFYYATRSVRDIRKTLETVKLDSRGICLLKQSEFTALEFYLVVYNCKGIGPGIYHFNLKNLTFDLIKEGDFTENVRSIQMGQNVVNNSAFSLYITVNFYKQMWRYRYPHKYRNLLIQIGKIAQDFITYALSFSIGSFMSPAIKDSECEELLDLNPIEEGVGYFMSFGLFHSKDESSYFFNNLPGPQIRVAKNE